MAGFNDFNLRDFFIKLFLFFFLNLQPYLMFDLDITTCGFSCIFYHTALHILCAFIQIKVYFLASEQNWKKNSGYFFYIFVALNLVLMDEKKLKPKQVKLTHSHSLNTPALMFLRF